MQNIFLLVLMGSASAIILFVLFIVLIYNEVHYSKYKKLMSHLQEHHFEVYEQIRIKPSLGPLFAKGAFKKSIDYAKNHPLSNDSIAEILFSDYAEFSQINPKIIRSLVENLFQKNLQIDYNKHDIRSGFIVGIVVGLVAGAIIGNVGLQSIEAIGFYYGAIIGSVGGIVGGVFSALREFSWKMAPFFRSIIGATLGAFGWVMAFSMLKNIVTILF